MAAAFLEDDGLLGLALMTCVFCEEIQTNPNFLPCQHLRCSNCPIAPCPTCRKKVEDFRKNYADKFIDKIPRQRIDKDFLCELMEEDLDEVLENPTSDKTDIWKEIQKLFPKKENTSGPKRYFQFSQSIYGYLEMEQIWDLIAGEGEDICDHKPNKPIRIAIIDSGVKPNHHAFTQGGTSESNVKEGVSFIMEQETDGKGWNDSDGHGTECASVAAGKWFKGKKEFKEIEGVIGVAPFCEIIPIAIKREGSTEKENMLENFVKAMEWIIKYHKEKCVDIVSLSHDFDLNCKRELQLINEATSLGIIVVVCASNEGAKYQYNIQYPARFGNVICVGAHDRLGRVSAFSSTGREVDFLAPGEYIYVVDKDGSIFVNIKQGTSYATPIVAGICALVLAFAEKCEVLEPDLRSRITHTQIMKQILHRMTTSPGFHDQCSGYGNIQPFKLFKFGKEGFISIVKKLQSSLESEGIKTESLEGVDTEGMPPTLPESKDDFSLQNDVKRPVENTLSLYSFQKSLFKKVILGNGDLEERCQDAAKEMMEIIKKLVVLPDTLDTLDLSFVVEDYGDETSTTLFWTAINTLSREFPNVKHVKKLILPLEGFKNETSIENRLIKDSTLLVVEKAEVSEIVNLFLALKRGGKKEIKIQVGKLTPITLLQMPQNLRPLEEELEIVLRLYINESQEESLPEREILERCRVRIIPQPDSQMFNFKEYQEPFPKGSYNSGPPQSQTSSENEETVSLEGSSNSGPPQSQTSSENIATVTVAIFGTGVDMYPPSDHLPQHIIGVHNTVPTEGGMFGKPPQKNIRKPHPDTVRGLTQSLIDIIKTNCEELTQVQFVVVKVVNDDGYYCHDWVLKGLKWLKDNNERLNVDVILIPLQFKDFSRDLYISIQKAISDGKLVVASPLSERTTVYQHLGFPASYGNVLCAGCCDVAGNVSSNSPTGREIDFILPETGSKKSGRWGIAGKVSSYSPSTGENIFTDPDDEEIDLTGLDTCDSQSSRGMDNKDSILEDVGPKERRTFPLIQANALLTAEICSVLAFAKSLDQNLADELKSIAVMRFVLQQASTQSGHHKQDTGHGTIYLSDLLRDSTGHRLKVLVKEISADYK